MPFQTLNAHWTNTCSRCPTASPALCRSQTEERFIGGRAQWKPSGTSCHLELSGRNISANNQMNNYSRSIRNEICVTVLFLLIRVAVNFLDSKSFCKNSHHIKGEALMRKRHLEILGYRVVQVRKHQFRLHVMLNTETMSDCEIMCFFQIPHFEWNSMELSTPDAWKDYLQKIIFKDISS